MPGSHLDAWLYRRCPGRSPFLATRWGRVAYQCWGPADGPTLLMVPDGPCVIAHFEELARRLSSHFRVVVADLPGFGFSAPAPGYQHRPDQVCEVLTALLDHLRIGRAVLNFTCVNGYYALALARRQPDRVRAVVLGQTPSLDAMRAWERRVIPRPLTWPLVGQLINYVGRRQLAHRWYSYALPKSCELAPWRQKSLNNLAAGGCNCLATLVQGMRSAADHEFAGVSQPVVAMWGTADRSHRPTAPDSILQLVPHAQLQVLEGVGHFPNLECPDLLEQHLSNWTS